MQCIYDQQQWHSQTCPFALKTTTFVPILRIPGFFINFPHLILNNFKTLTIHLLIRNILRTFVSEK